GVALAMVFAVVELANPQVRTRAMNAVMGWAERGRQGSVPAQPEVQVVAVEGPLLFVGVERLRERLSRMPARVLVLDFTGVSTVEASGALRVGARAEGLRREGRVLNIGGMGRGPLGMVVRMGVLGSIGRRRVTLTLAAAVMRAQAEAQAMARAADAAAALA